MILIAHAFIAIYIGYYSYHFYRIKFEGLRKRNKLQDRLQLSRSPSGLGSVILPIAESSPSEKSSRTRKLISSASVSKIIIGCSSVSERFNDEKYGQFRVFKDVFLFLFPLVTVIVVGSIVIAYVEDYDFVDAVYWTTMTATTVGYGDLYPTSSTGKWFCIFFIPVCVASIAMSIANIVDYFVDKEIRKNELKLLRREVTVEDLEMMDVDEDDHVDLLEFVQYFLIAMKKVDKELLNQLHKKFKQLDADGSGGLQKADLDILSARKLKTMQRVRIVNNSHSDESSTGTSTPNLESAESGDAERKKVVRFAEPEEKKEDWCDNFGIFKIGIGMKK